MTSEEREVAQDKYVDARLEGHSKIESTELAGYAAGTKPSQVDHPGSPAALKLEKALAERGLNEEFLAKEYAEGIQAAKQPGAREKDLNAYSQLLKQLGFLMGHGKRETPQVAVQINNGVSRPEDDAPATRDLIAEVAALVTVLASQVGKDQQLGVHDGNPGPASGKASSRVVEPTEPSQDAGSRGSA